LRRLPDYHLHTNATEDGEASFEEMVRSAAEKGLDEILVNDHYIRGLDTYCISKPQLEENFRAAERLGRETGVKVLMGLEVDYFRDSIKEIENVTGSFDFDVIIGAAHFVDGWGVASEGHAIKLVEMHGAAEAYRMSMRALEEAIECGLFDVMAHLDIVRKFTAERYGPVPFEEYAEEAERAARALVESGTGFEVNCRGYDHEPREQYPGDEFLSVLRHAGLDSFTVGSDSHCTELVGAYLERGARTAREAGFTHVNIFRGRKARKTPLSEFDLSVRERAG